jgi:hypothetical protein
MPELGVGEQRFARGGGRQKRRVEHTPRQMQAVRDTPSQPLGMKPLSHREDKRLRGRR